MLVWADYIPSLKDNAIFSVAYLVVQKVAKGRATVATLLYYISRAFFLHSFLCTIIYTHAHSFFLLIRNNPRAWLCLLPVSIRARSEINYLEYLAGMLSGSETHAFFVGWTKRGSLSAYGAFQTVSQDHS